MRLVVKSAFHRDLSQRYFARLEQAERLLNALPQDELMRR
jgi:hypothetical protein